MMKPSEINKMNVEQLDAEQQRLRRQLYDLKSQSVTEKLENPRQLAGIRRDIARVLTEQRMRQLQEQH